MNSALNIFTDGGARGNPGPAACAFVVKDNDDKTIHSAGKYLGETTNNFAEYNGVITALEWLAENQNKNIDYHFFLDSSLVVNQLNGLFKIKNANLRDLIIKVRILERKINSKIDYQYIPREKNFDADKLLNNILDDSR
jgi:ribonuclease HI